MDVSDREDLIASGKIKPAPEFVEINGKMIRTSPPKYESEDDCGKARELYLWRMKNKLFRYEELGSRSYSFPTSDAGGLINIMKDYQGTIWADNFEYNSEFWYQIYDKVTKSKSKEVYFRLYRKLMKDNQEDWWNTGFKIIKNNINLDQRDYGDVWVDIEESSVNKYLFMKQKDCIVTFYKGEEF